MYRKAALQCGFFLPLLDCSIVEFLYTPALQTDDVVVMVSAIEFEHGFTTLEMVTHQ